MRPLRSYLPEMEFVDLIFVYQLEGVQLLPVFPELALRAPLQQAGMELLEPDRFTALFTPDLPVDPTALRRYQRPAPPFALQPSPPGLTPTETDQGVISCRLFGSGISFLDDLIRTMAAIRPFLFSSMRREGRLLTVHAVDGSGQGMTIWQEGMARPAPPPRITAAWRLEPLGTNHRWEVEIFTPMRLLVAGKPLFRPQLRHLLPFILRRVTANAYFCHHLEFEGAAELLNMASGIAEEEGDLRWIDWRNHQGEGELRGLGGVCGKIRLTGNLPDEIIDLLRLGALMNIGKGAAYGAGAYRFLSGSIEE